MPEMEAWVHVPGLATSPPSLAGYAERPLGLLVQDNSTAPVLAIPPDQMVAAPGRVAIGPEWRCATTRLRRVGPGGFLLCVRWDRTASEIAINGRVAGVSGPVNDHGVIEIGGDLPPDRSSDWAKRSAQAKEARRRAHNASAEAADRAAQARLAEQLHAAIAGLRPDPALLCALLAPAQGIGLLQRVAGSANRALPVYGAFARGTIAVSAFDPDCVMPMPLITPLRQDERPTMLDLDVWLRLRSWLLGGTLFDNATILQAMAGVEGPHPELPGLRRFIESVADRHAPLIAAWLVMLAEVAGALSA
jgi:hypothetical protein